MATNLFSESPSQRLTQARQEQSEAASHDAAVKSELNRLRIEAEATAQFKTLSESKKAILAEAQKLFADELKAA